MMLEIRRFEEDKTFQSDIMFPMELQRVDKHGRGNEPVTENQSLITC